MIETSHHWLLSVPDLIAFWDFQEGPGSPRQSRVGDYALQEAGGEVRCAEEGVFGARSACFGHGPWLEIPRCQTADLNICGKEAQVSVVAWLKRHQVAGVEGKCQAVAGLWNEHGKRQYCLFLNLRIHASAEQVGGHVSGIGDPTPGEKYCMDAAIGATPVPFGEWVCVAMSYNGEQACAYLNGELDAREHFNPYGYELGIFDGGDNGADFTVGAVARPNYVDENRTEHGHVQSNLFFGLLGGLAVFKRALSADEMRELHRIVAEAQPHRGINQRG